MSVGEIAYLTLVIASFVTFISSLAFVSWYSGKKLAARPEHDAQIHELRAGLRKAA